jgi:hypothetical protein
VSSPGNSAACLPVSRLISASVNLQVEQVADDLAVAVDRARRAGEAEIGGGRARRFVPSEQWSSITSESIEVDAGRM